MTVSEKIILGTTISFCSVLIGKIVWSWLSERNDKVSSTSNDTELNKMAINLAEVKNEVIGIFNKNSDTHNRMGRIEGHISCIANEFSDQGNQLCRVETELGSFVKESIKSNAEIVGALKGLHDSQERTNAILVQNGQLLLRDNK